MLNQYDFENFRYNLLNLLKKCILQSHFHYIIFFIALQNVEFNNFEFLRAQSALNYINTSLLI